ncbi:unnamed protein product [Nesidiocoris tenuis]|uniref:N-terminal acetyltransferase B complex subunit MDM20 homolog n=2 Tax=Nesidiocoris tenuis TaxID=355587 RepID=A0A6H5HQL7_9HEMI|nr:Phagocyte signaling-impaired protein [Nesidiocoris tenuis]CAB0016959.1 unnamed protein product [Nesidiocoris tenuis]
MATRVTPCPLAEKKMRPIYDLLDIGNNKKALQEADKLLKKKPNLSTALALKCLALLRLGKETESLDILEKLKNEGHVEESTLQVATVCYRESHRPHAICELYEKASAREPTSEDILTNLFLSYVRVNDFTKQRLAAISLNKLQPKNQYSFWTFISTLLQSVDSVNDLIPLCAIPADRHSPANDFVPSDKAKNAIALVHRLISKLANEGKLETEQEVLTYMLVLEMLRKYEEALTILDGPLASKLEPWTVLNKKLDLLVKLSRWEQVNDQCERMLSNDSDCWHCYLIYIDSVFELGNDRDFNIENKENPHVKAKAFIESLISSQEDAQFKKRGPYLARLEHYTQLMVRKMPAVELYGELLPLLKTYYVEFGSKETCVHDLRKYLQLSSEDAVKFLSFTYKIINLGEDGIPTDKNNLNLLASNLMLCRITGVNSVLGVNDERKFILNAVNKYISCRHLCLDAALTDPKPCDYLALVAAHSLFDLYISTEDTNYLFDGIVLCEYVVSQSSHDVQMKILLLKFYHLLGGTEGAHMVYNSLDLKHMQLDTLGYLHLFPLLANASYDHATLVLNSSIKFFTNNSKESADHVTFAYKYEALTKIPEFIGIKDRMTNSAHCLLSTVEKMLCEMFTAPGFTNAIELAKAMEITVNLERIQWNELWDNRDFSLLWDIEAPDQRLTEECIVQSHNHNLLLLRLKSLHLHSIVTALNIGKAEPNRVETEADQLKEPDETNKDLTYAKTRSKLMDYIVQFEEALKPVKHNIPSPLSKRYIAGPPVSRLTLMLQVNYFDLILIQLRFLHSIVPCEDGNHKKCQFQLDSMVLFMDEYLNYLRTITGSPLIQLRNTVIQVCALLVELICFSCIVVGVCEVILNKSRPNFAKRNKRKKENAQRVTESPDEFEWRVSLFNQFVTFMVEIVKNVESLLKSEEKLWDDKKSKVCELAILGNVENQEEAEKLKAIGYGSVMKTLCHSYTSNISLMSTVLKEKTKYLNSRKLQGSERKIV